MEPIAVLLADDHMIVREGLRTLLNAEGDIRVVGEAANGREAVALVRKLRPAVVVMDIAMSELNGLEASRQILKAVPGTRVIVLSAHGDEAFVQQAVELGAAGFLLKQTSAHMLAQAVRAASEGKTFFCPSIARTVKMLFRPARGLESRVRDTGGVLSSREAEVLQLIAEGQANKQVASNLGISVKTVEKHRQRLMEKLGIHDTAGLTRYAISKGIIESSVQVTIV